jgi:hypothetical protein
MDQEGIWLSILDYARVKKISISTIRRSIKSGIINYKLMDGKYFIYTKKEQPETEVDGFDILLRENKKLKEEITDLKMLLSVYETSSSLEI